MKNIHALSIGLILLLMCCSPSKKLGTQSSKDKESSQPIKNWELVWEESFDTDDSLDTTKWSVIKRNKADWGNYMSDHPDCIIIQDGKLYLRGIVNENLKQDTARYLTGGVDTKGKFAFQYGKIEIRAKLEHARGAWPAMWMLADQPKYGKYPRNGEIDLMEHLNFENKVYQTVHSYYTLELKQKTNPPYYTTHPIETENFNTYGLEWSSDKLTFTINGEETFTYPRLEGADKSQWPFDQPFYLMIDMQLGGSWVGAVDPGDLPVQMIIDWVQVYQEKELR